MKEEDIRLFRLNNQKIRNAAFQTSAALVAEMGAMQAQDFTMAKWAIGLRGQGATHQLIEEEISKAQIIRTHILRPTWHFVAAENIHWMLALSAPQIRGVLSSRNRTLELDSKMITKGLEAVSKHLQGNKHLVREELVAKLQQGEIWKDTFRASHLLLHAETEGIICSGATKNNKITYALLSERVPNKKYIPPEEEALTKLAFTYFNSHGPATMQDFIWWSGLPIRKAKLGLELNKANLESFYFEDKTYWMRPGLTPARKFKSQLVLLPAFDEYLISYKDRSAALLNIAPNRVFSNNGIFWPVVLLDGKVIGLWKRTIKKEQVFIRFEFFTSLDKSLEPLLHKAARQYGDFLNKELILA